MKFFLDFDIFSSFLFKTKPCVKTSLYGATPFIATDITIEDINQPLC